MNYRSWLLVPGSSEKKLGRAVGTGADAIIVDLADTVPDEFKAEARRLSGGWLNVHRQTVLERRMGRWVRINAMDGRGLWREDLLAVMPYAPDGIVLPKAGHLDMVRQLAAEIYELEQRNQIPANSTHILPIVGQTARSAITIGQFLELGHQRLFGLAWTANDLCTAIAAKRIVDAEGQWTDTFRYVRSQTLLTAHACGVIAIDDAHSELNDKRGLGQAARNARADGFAGMMANHPDQVPVINEAFMPSDAELSEAREIIAAFEENPEAGVLEIRGKMIERPHLELARRMAGQSSKPVPQMPPKPPAILRPA